MLTGQVETPWVGRGRGALHEADNQIEMLRSVTRRAETVRHHSEIAATVVRCGADALSGRPRPAAVEIPIDLQYSRGEVAVPAVTRQSERPAEAALERAAALLEHAERPLLWAGGGVITADGAAAFTALAELLAAPALTSAHGRGAIPEDHPLALGANSDQAAMDPMIADADVVVAVGTRFQMTGNLERALTIPGRLIHVDVDPTVIGRNHRAAVAVAGDARLTLEALTTRLAEHRPVAPAWAEQGRAARAAAEAELRDAMGTDVEKIMDCMRAALPRDAVVVKDSTIAAYIWANRLLHTYEPRTTMRPQSAAIGPGVPLAIGAAVGSGRRTVVIQGDGGLMLSLGELATAVQQRLPLVVCVFNDRGYGILRYLQDVLLDGRRTGVDLATPDFVALARAMGMEAEPVDSVEHVRGRLWPRLPGRRALAARHRSGGPRADGDPPSAPTAKGLNRWIHST